MDQILNITIRWECVTKD